MSFESSQPSSHRPQAILWITIGALMLAIAWTIPINLRSLTPAILKEAGRSTPSVGKFGRQILDSEKLGPATLFLDAARQTDVTGVPALEQAIRSVETRRPEWIAWGGWDPYLDPIINLRENSAQKTSTPVLTFLIAEKVRTNIQSYLANSRSLGVQALLQTRAIDRTTQFIPALRPGGQTLDAVILLSALLYQGEHLSDPLQRQLRTLAETSIEQKQLGELETFYIDLLSLGKRLNWIQLSELLRTTDSTKTLGEFAHVARLAKEDLPLIYSAALLSNSADKVATYLITFGKQGLSDLTLALRSGQGAVRVLLDQQAPINTQASLSLGAVAEFSLLNPRLALVFKYLGFFLGAFALFRGLALYFIDAGSGEISLRMQSSVLALLCSALLILATEPYLLKTLPPSEFRVKIVMPVLASAVDAPPSTTKTTPTTMDNKTLLSIAFFAALQVGMYLFCLRKIRYISRQNIPAAMKLRLMENEENLFDAGLYIGIGGTAISLVAQVLGLIQANLLAAYASNLFGITCVALIKIIHVRTFKRELILDGGISPNGNAASLRSPAAPVAPRAS